ncbi:hypothetical protein N7513_009724 [Penicillium frequentans]|nr:hypothetical protein N7513_009724 [Penicillium glabrum]
MNSPKMSLSPLPPPSFASPGSPRKRSIHEVDGATLPSVGPKRALTSYTENNQENHDPTSGPQKEATELNEKDHSTVQPPRQVAIPVKTPDQSPVARTIETTLVPSTTEESNQGRKGKKEEEKKKREEEKRLREEEKKKRDAEREEEKRLKEDEKKKREAEREEKKKAKEEEKAAKEVAKEDDKRRKEEAKLKKERAQPKLNSFFAKPQVPASPTKSISSPQKAAPVNNAIIGTSQPPVSDYAKAFPDFFLQSHTIVAPPHRFERDTNALAHVQNRIDASLNLQNGTYEHQPFRPTEIFNLIPYQRRCGRQAHSVKEILQRMHTLSDAANQPHVASASVKSDLSHIPMKSLKFGEDVRPAYQGTYTRPIPKALAHKVARNPYRRGLPETDYDYDSEAEWEEPEEGEDLDSEEEEEASDEGEDDMDEFLDDEDDALKENKRRLIVGELEPVCSGIRWATDGVDEELKGYRMEVISDTVKFPIDPFSTAYWQKPRATDQAPKGRVTQKPGGSLDVFRVQPGTDAAAVLSEFKEVVEGSDLSKIGVIEILKKRFPKVSKDTLKATLDQVAVRVGQKEVDKKWVCR